MKNKENDIEALNFYKPVLSFDPEAIKTWAECDLGTYFISQAYSLD